MCVCGAPAVPLSHRRALSPLPPPNHHHRPTACGWRGVGGSIMEAMALGVPVVARRNVGNDTVLGAPEGGTEGHAGAAAPSPSPPASAADPDAFVVACGALVTTPAQCVRACAAVLDDPALRAGCVARASARTAALYSAHAEAAAWLRVVWAAAGWDTRDSPGEAGPVRGVGDG